MADHALDPVRIGRFWHFPTGEILPVISGGSDDGPPPDPPPTPDPAPPAADDKPLGEAGEKALEAWKQRAKTAEAEAKRAKELEAELAALRESQMSDQEKALAEAKREAADAAKAEVLGTVNRRLFASEVKVAAQKLADPDLLADPDVAVRLLGLGEIPVTDSGDIDAEAISAAVDAFLAGKPHLAAGATRPAPLNQGARPQSGVVDLAAVTDPKKVREMAAGLRRN
jgi:hypothetical protein